MRLCVASLVALCFFLPATAQTEKKQACGILIDNTGSLRSQFDIVVDVSKGIIVRNYQRGPVSLFSFKNEGGISRGTAVISSDFEWSQDKDDLENSLDSMYIVPGQTALLDGISRMAQELNTKTAEDKDGFAGKVIFLITDGEDRSSKINEKDLIKLLKDSGIQVFAVGLIHDLDGTGGFMSKTTKGKSASFLGRITKETGGRLVLAKTNKDDPQTLLSELFAK